MRTLYKSLKFVGQVILDIMIIVYAIVNNIFKGGMSYRPQNAKISEEEMIVIGNGPSFATTFEKYGQLLAEHPCLCVNFAALTNEFLFIKPRYYLLVDPCFFNYINERASLSLRIEELIQCLVNNIDWDVHLFVPTNELRSDFCRRIASNKHIKLHGIADLYVFFHLSDWARHYLISKNLILPPSQTVINTALCISIMLKARRIYLVGADSSFVEQLRIDQNNNKLYYSATHYYKDDKDDKERQYSDYDYEEELGMASKAFYCYKYIARYAKYCGAVICNSSEFSFIDCFPRKPLSEIENE